MLTKIDIKALRKCDRVCFDYRDGKSAIRAIKSAPDGEPFDNDKTHRIECEHRETVYREDGSTYGQKLASCFDMIHSAKYDREWLTIVGLLREGDELRLCWSAGGASNGYIKDAKLRGDTLTLEVRRNGNSKYSFHLATQVCAVNSASMCQLEAAREYQLA
jgi:hypothetical protein